MNDIDKLSGRVSLMTVIGLALLVGPLATVAHEIGGHAATCLAVDGRITEIGAYYVQCATNDPAVRRLVAIAGTAMDVLLFVLFYASWRHAHGDLARLILWLLFTVKGMQAAGYWLFSGATGIGDWGPGTGGGIGPLPHEMPWRIGLFAVGIAAYIGLVRLAIGSVRTMIGGGPEASVDQKRIALGFYVVNGALAVIVGLLNPHGFFITLASAAASSFGGTIGMIRIAYARSDGPPLPFLIAPSVPLLLAGIIVAACFGIVLGPTLYPG